MSRRGAIGLGLAALLAAAGTPAAAAPFDFMCVAPFGEDSEIWQERTGPPYRVSGRIRPIALADILPPSFGEGVRIPGPPPDTRRAVVEFTDWGD